MSHTDKGSFYATATKQKTTVAHQCVIEALSRDFIVNLILRYTTHNSGCSNKQTDVKSAKVFTVYGKLNQCVV